MMARNCNGEISARISGLHLFGHVFVDLVEAVAKEALLVDQHVQVVEG